MFARIVPRSSATWVRYVCDDVVSVSQLRRAMSNSAAAASGAQDAGYKHLKLEPRRSSLWISMNRPDVHNSFNEELIAEIRRVFQTMDAKAHRSVVLTGEGVSFSAGADLNWMKKMAKYTAAQNEQDARDLFDMFLAIRECPLPVIARVNGAALGGGSGLVASCDFAFSVKSAVLGFTEVKLGLVPAVISRFVMDKIGKGHASRYFLTGERFTADTAVRVGLVQQAFDTADEMDTTVNKVIDEIAGNSPAAMRSCKQLIETVSQQSIRGSKDAVAKIIAEARASAEGQEGLTAFFEKRKPSYVQRP